MWQKQENSLVVGEFPRRPVSDIYDRPAGSRVFRFLVKATDFLISRSFPGDERVRKQTEKHFSNSLRRNELTEVG